MLIEVTNWQNLFCQTGKHRWMRLSSRGRKPFSCPACIEQDESQRQEKKELRQEAVTLGFFPPNCGDEDRRKLEYIDSRLKLRGSDLSDNETKNLALMEEVRRDIVDRYRRGNYGRR